MPDDTADNNAEPSLLHPVSAPTSPCKCCGAESPLYGVCDFSKNCEVRRGVRLPLTGVPIFYYRCQSCGFLFTNAFDAFSHADFVREIYNDAYGIVDPDYIERRPNANANLIKQLLGQTEESVAILDYGGGNGALAARLSQLGIRAGTYEPFSAQFNTRPNGHFDLVVSFEVVEHVVDPIGVFRDMISFLDSERGIIVFSTLLQPKDIAQAGINWWYVGPRNGHISIHTQKSLTLAINACGLKLASFNQGLHVAFNEVPGFARRWFNKGSVER